MIDKRTAQRLVGETTRDVGILLFVFGPLDALYQPAQPGVLPVVLAALGLCFMAVGIILEARDSESSQ